MPRTYIRKSQKQRVSEEQIRKVIASTGKKQVGRLVSAERGELVTFIGIVNAIGNTIPPILVFPRVKFKNSFMNGSPVGSIGLAHKSGWMVAELFIDLLKHIKKHTNCDQNNKILIIMDNHRSHVSLEGILYARENGIILLSFPPHCSHKMQPLDVAVYGPFITFLKVAQNDFMSNNNGKAITIYDIPNIAKVAYEKAFIMSNIIAGFKKPGIWPLNTLAFSDDDFAASYVSDRPEHITGDVSTIITGEHITGDVSTDQLPCSEQNIVCDYPVLNNSPSIGSNPAVIDILSLETVAVGCTQFPDSVTILEQIKPYPKLPGRKNKTKRERGKSRIYTDTPEKDKILNQTLDKQKKMRFKIQKSKKSGIGETEKLKKIIRKKSKLKTAQHQFGSSDDLPEDHEQCGDQTQDYLLDDDVVNKGDFILVKFVQKNNNVFYVGLVDDVISQQDFDILFLRQKENGKYVFPLIKDKSQITRSDITLLLPLPVKLPGSTRMAQQYQFKTDLSTYNMR